MADYDGSIRIGTKIDTQGFDEDGKKLEAKAKKLANNISGSSDVEIKIDASGAKKEIEEVFEDIEKEEKRIEELAKKAVEKAQSQQSKIAASEEPRYETISSQGYNQEAIKFIEDYEKETLKANEHLERIDRIRVNAVARNDEIIAKVERIKQLEQEIADLETAETTLGYADYEDAIQELAGLKQEIREYRDEITNIQKPVEESSEAWKKYQATLEQVRSAHAGLVPPIEAIKASLAYMIDVIKEKLSGLAQSIKYGITHPFQTLKKVASNTFNFIKKGFSAIGKLGKSAFSGMTSIAKNAFSSITSGAKKSSGLLSTFASRMKGLALSLLIFNWISKGFNAMISGMKAGFSNFAGYSDSYAQSIQNMKNAMSTLGNQFAAAFAPIVQMVIPWLNSLINAITTAMTYVAQFFAVLGGKSTFTKAKKLQDSYNKSLGGTAKAADKARGALAKFDDLDVLQKQDDAGGGGGAGEDFGDMFEEVPIESSVSDLFRTLKDLIYGEDWEGLGSFVAESLNKGLEKIYDLINWDNVGPRVTYFVNAFTETFNSLVDNLDWDLLGRTIGAGINTIVNTINLLFDGIDWENLGKKLGEGMNGLVDEINWEELGRLLLQKLNASIETLYGFAKEFDWEKLGTSLGEAVNGAIDSIEPELWANTLSELVKGIFDTIIKFLEETDWQEMGNKIADFIGGIDYSGVSDKFFEAVGAVIASAFELLWGLIEDSWKQIVEWWKENAYEDGQFTMKGLLDGIVEALKNIGSWIKEHIFEPFMKGFKNAFEIHSPSKVMEGMGKNIVNGLLDGLKATWNDVVDWLTGKIQWLKEKLRGIGGGIKSAFTGGDTSFSTYSVDTRTMARMHDVPRLATGSVIRGGNPFMAILGDQPAGQVNIEAPADLIKDMARQGIREELKGMNLGNNMNPVISLNVNGEEFARLTLGDTLNEMARQGYDVSVLGVT